jgi:hypothetical protein
MNSQLLEINTSNVLLPRIRFNLRKKPTCFLCDSLDATPAPRNTYTRQDYLYINIRGSNSGVLENSGRQGHEDVLLGLCFLT